MSINYDLWPNPEGPLGKIKKTIPENKWPDGDSLVGNFIYKNGNISAFVDTKALIVNESSTTTLPYDYVDTTFDYILDGTMTFNKGERTRILVAKCASLKDYVSSYLQDYLEDEKKFKVIVDDGGNKAIISLPLEMTENERSNVLSFIKSKLPEGKEVEIDEIPIDFERLEYLIINQPKVHSTGQNRDLYQYVDTSVTMTKDIGLKSVHQILNLHGRYLFGVGHVGKNINGTSSDVGTFCTHGEPFERAQHHLISYGWGTLFNLNLAGSNAISVTINDKQYAELNWLNNGKWKIYLTENGNTFDGDISNKDKAEHLQNNIFLFALNDSGKPHIIPWASPKIKWFSGNISNGDTEICKFVPVLHKDSGESGIFDTIRRVFLTNMGSGGDFDYPNKVSNTITYDLRNRMYGKKTIYGIRRLYRIPNGYNSKKEYADEHGYKLIFENSMPEEGNWIPEWTETETELILNWIEV